MVSLEPASAEMNGVQLMARSLDAIARADVEVLVVSSSSYRQNFCVLVREDELERSLQALESALALELAHQYVHPIQVDRNVGLLAAVGEGMQGKPGLAGRIFTAISRVQVNIIAIAQGSSELTIAVVVRRDGLEKAVKAVHAECGLGMRPPVPVFPFGQSEGRAPAVSDRKIRGIGVQQQKAPAFSIYWYFPFRTQEFCLICLICFEAEIKPCASSWEGCCCWLLFPCSPTWCRTTTTDRHPVRTR